MNVVRILELRANSTGARREGTTFYGKVAQRVAFGNVATITEQTEESAGRQPDIEVI